MNEEKTLQYLKRLTTELRDTKQRLRCAEERDREPIAVIGMACRFPGGVRAPEQLWRLVAAEQDAIDEFPRDRGWDLASITSDTHEGGFLYDAAEFDADFFGISPREALAMDPQQRLLLETSWEAVERSGIVPGSLRGSRTGVFVGVMYHDYASRLPAIPEVVQGYLGTGNSGSIASGRLAYTLGLEGPAVTIDTACSSSLVALHLACRALRRSECSAALVGGATVMASPAPFVDFSRQQGLAPDGRCKAFSSTADGTGWAEGAGMLLVERLSDAQRNGHPVLAIIRGSAVNQDGASNGLTAPNGPSQQRVIRDALVDAGLRADQVDAVEAHGTGTRLGDPIEAQALLATYGQNRETPLWLGSIKSNLGHTQAAAGIAGIIKMVQAMHQGILPRTLHIAEPTPEVDWESGAVSLLTEKVPWPQRVPRRAAVSSFGFSGTNAHVILEQAPDAADSPAEPVVTPPVVPWVLSARTETDLRAQAAQLAEHLTDEAPVLDVGYSLGTARTAFDERAVLLAGSTAERRRALSAFAAGEAPAAVLTGRAGEGGLAMVFSGQGSQRLGMGRELYETFPVFADAFDAVCAEIDPHLPHPLANVVFGTDGEPINRTQYAQPALFAIEVAICRLWQHWGIQPSIVAGHSVGEIAAAHIAGVLSLTDAATLVCARGRLMQSLPPGGAMVAIDATEDDVLKLLAGNADKVGIAAINGPNSLVLSGDHATLTSIAGSLRAAGNRVTWLRVSHAFHSPLIDPVLPEFRDIAAALNYSSPTLPMVSTVTGQLVDDDTLSQPEYWVRHARHTVRFAEAITALSHHATTFLEVGPSASLTPHLPDDALSSLRHNDAESAALATALGKLITRASLPDWRNLYANSGACTTALPTYPFARKRYWLESAESAATDVSAAGLLGSDHPLLTAAVGLAEGDRMLLTGSLSLTSHPWLADHTVLDRVVVPGAALVELALHAGQQAGHPHLAELTLGAPLVLTDSALHVQTLLGEPDGDGGRPVSIFTREADASFDQPWTKHAEGRLTGQTPQPAEMLTQWPPTGTVPLDINGFYGSDGPADLRYGPAFQGLRGAWQRDGEIFADVALGDDQLADADRFALHPALLDSALHAIGLSTQPGEHSSIPFSWTDVSLHAVNARELRVRISPAGPDAVSLVLADQTGRPVLTVARLHLRPIPEEGLPSAATRSLYRVSWVPLPDLDRPTPPGRWAAITTDAQFAGQADEYGDLSELGRAIDDGKPVPEVVLVPFVPPEGDTEDKAERAAVKALELAQQWLADDRFAASRLALITRSALLLDSDTAADVPAALANAAVWGLMRSAQSEHPDRFLLVDLDDTDASPLRPIATALACGEPQIALRNGTTHTPRLTHTTPPHHTPPNWTHDTILITGATGALGTLITHHLIHTHQPHHLHLLSRNPPHNPPTTINNTHLTHHTCDLTNPHHITHTLNTIPPPTIIIHCAGTLHDATLTHQTPHHLHHTFTPKTTAAHHLHTHTHPNTTHIHFSSAAATLGTPGQANYAAANAYLDALAHHHPNTTTIAWGPWNTGMTGDLDALPAGIRALTEEEGLRLFDAALASGESVVLPMHLDARALAASRGGAVPALLRKLVPTTPRRAAQGEPDASTLADRLHRMSEVEQDDTLLGLVRGQVAGVLGHTDPDSVEPARAFGDFGFDSLTSVEFRNRLNSATGLRLPATLVFDHPTPIALARHLRTQLLGAPERAVESISVRSADDDPIVIIGMACRYPGGVDNPEELWRLVATGADAISPFPTDRGWDEARIYDPDGESPGSSYVREGGFLHNAAEFDPALFGISPREAHAMDPQQRLLLETTWEALERATIDPTSLHGTRTGVFAGVMYSDYATRFSDDTTHSSGNLGNGSAPSIASGRISYAFGLQGPAITIDTACSSSLVALHLAAQSLRNGECDLALAGGVTVMATPAAFIEFSRQRGLSADGRCKAFSSTADGTGWGEGIGIVLLERLSDAHRNHHPVLAVVRGSAINQDGASNGLTAPNGPSQQRVIRQALANAGLAPSEVDAVEAHGTGTRLGDPIEAQALLATYGHNRQTPLWLGSIKSNIGHTQAAAGIAGIIKMIQAMHHGTLPQTLHIDQPTPEVDWNTGAIELLTQNQQWPDTGRPRRAAISSFGISGTNAHVILEQPPAETAPAQPPRSENPVAHPAAVPWLLSAHTKSALRAQAARLAERLTDDDSILDVGYSLATTRAALAERAVIVTSDLAQGAQALAALAQGTDHPDLHTGRAAENSLAMVFSGQGSQRHRMGHQLYETYPAFADAFDTACAAIDPHLPRPLRDAVFGEDPELINQTQYAQPALFAYQTALYQLWRYWGVQPTILAGHSIGEITAAHTAGALSLSDAAALICARGRLMQSLPPGGAMVAITASENAIAAYHTGHENAVSVAAINSPTSLVLSGDRSALATITESLRDNGHRTTWLRVSHAFHSPLMESILAEFRDTAAKLKAQPATVPIVSTRTGQLIDDTTLANPDHWVQHARHTVQFARAASTLNTHATTFLEIGPANTLTPHLPNTAVASQRHDQPEAAALTTALGQLVAHGISPDWQNHYAQSGARATPLPTYPFQHARYWLHHHPTPADPHTIGLDRTHHPLLDAVAGTPDADAVVFSGRVSLAAHPWLADHAVGDQILLPGTAFVDLALHAGAHLGNDVLDDLTLETPLVIPERGAVDIQLTVGAADTAGRRTARIHSRESHGRASDEHPWVRNATAVLRHAEEDVSEESAEHWPPPGAVPLGLDAVYEELAEKGLRYGPAFRGLRAAWRRADDLYVEVSLPEDLADTGGRHVVHPALLDSVLHAVGLGDFAETGAALPFAWRGVRVATPGAHALRGRLESTGGSGISLHLSGVDGRSVGRVAELTLRPVEAMATVHRSLFAVEWRKLGAAGAVTPAAGWAVVGEGETSLSRALRDSGTPVESYPDLAKLSETVAESGAAVERVFVPRTEPHTVGGIPALANRLVTGTVELLRDWLANEHFRSAQLVLVTRGATGPHPHPAYASIWGLVRAAQAEHPGRLTLIDLDPEAPEISWPELAAVLASGEPEAALQQGAVRVPRLVPAAAAETSAVDLTDGTVLITGASGALGRTVARHLVLTRGVRDLLLISRSGNAGLGMTTFVDELASAGAHVTSAACDAADRCAVASLLDTIPEDRPLRAVVHCAGVLDDGVLGSLTAERLARVLRPKVDAAWHLHELTEDLDLAAFVLFSSAAGTLGSAGQGAYAAGNTFLDALAAHRRAKGLAGLSLAWGPWDVEGGMAADRHRLERGGVVPFSPAEGLALLDVALARPEPVLVPVRVDTSVLRAAADREALPRIWHGLVRPKPRTSRRHEATENRDPRELRTRLADLAVDEREEALLDLLRGEVAAVLGYRDAEEVGVDRAFTELGFDSLTAVELRNRLERVTGLRLPGTVVFDHPTPPALARFLWNELDDGARAEHSTAVDTLGAYFRQACEQGRIEEGMELVRHAARLRAAFHSPDELRQRPHPVPLARGPRTPTLLCFPAVVAMSGAHQYARFAAALQDSRDTVVLPEPGFLAGEQLPGSVDALVESQAQAALDHANGAPVALLGYSSGGWIAHAVAERLERWGQPANAVILVDTYLPLEMNPRLQKAFTGGLFSRREQFVSMDHVSLTAMGGYFEVFGDWEPRSINTPALFVRARDPLPDETGAPLAESDWGPTWSLCDARAEAPGDHFTIMEEHAGTTARTVDAWLTDLPAPDGPHPMAHDRTARREGERE